jgi:sterol 3beta-glucosyltransferase
MTAAHLSCVGDVRAIISKGWSARMNKQNEPEVEMPEECYSLDKVPHEYVFR